MTLPYYLFEAGEQHGPLDIAGFKHLWISGGISSEAHYWQEGLADWQPLPPVITSIAERLESAERNWNDGRSDFALFAYPGIELVRIWPTEFGERDWSERWQRAGGTAHPSGRFLARKDSEVWQRLGSAELFPDALGFPFPPFAFGSGMGTRDVPREEAITLGLISSSTDIPGPPKQRKKARRVAQQFDPAFLAALKDDLDAEINRRKRNG